MADRHTPRIGLENAKQELDNRTSWHTIARSRIDELITPDGEPYDDALLLVQYILCRALVVARGGMGRMEAAHLQSLLGAI